MAERVRRNLRRPRLFIRTHEYHCDVCATPVVFTNRSYTTDPLQHIHICPRCGKEHALKHVYPFTT